MGNVHSYTYSAGTRSSYVPDSFEEPTFDPEYGFKMPRQERVSQISEQEMKALKISKDNRDYCAHFIKDYLVCMNQYTPVYGLCSPEAHAYEHCQKEDTILRMKEYEREKRLRMRALRKEKAVS